MGVMRGQVMQNQACSQEKERGREIWGWVVSDRQPAPAGRVAVSSTTVAPASVASRTLSSSCQTTRRSYHAAVGRLTLRRQGTPRIPPKWPQTGPTGPICPHPQHTPKSSVPRFPPLLCFLLPNLSPIHLHSP